MLQRVLATWTDKKHYERVEKKRTPEKVVLDRRSVGKREPECTKCDD